jgi:hypothetical protein
MRIRLGAMAMASSVVLVAAATFAGMGIAPAQATTDHHIVAWDTTPQVGFGVPPSPGDAIEPTKNLADFAAVNEGGGFYEWQAPDAAGQNECITANVNDDLVDSAPCGEYPASQDWNYNNYGGYDTLYNNYSGKCIAASTPYFVIATCPSTASPAFYFATPDA